MTEPITPIMRVTVDFNGNEIHRFDLAAPFVLDMAAILGKYRVAEWDRCIVLVVPIEARP